MDKKTKGIPKKWNSQREGFQESLRYLQGRMQGSIKSLRTPWPKFNDAMTDGIEWNTLTVIGGRPSSGSSWKIIVVLTTRADCLIHRSAFIETRRPTIYMFRT